MMTKFSTGLMKKTVTTASFLTLLMSGLAQAADHLLSVNGTTGTPATLSQAGVVTAPLNLTNFDSNTSVSFGTGQTLTSISIPVKLCKPGTGGQLEWLDQGIAVIGVNGSLTSTNITGYTLTLTTSYSDSYAGSNGSCSPSGAKSYLLTTNNAVITKASDSNFNISDTYNLWNANNTVPEPGTLLLTLMGLLGLGWFSKNRLRNA